MREYDKMTLKVAERIFEKGDKILEQRQKKSAKIRHISYAVSGLCASVLVCLGIWKLNPFIKNPKQGFTGSEIILQTETTSESAITTEKATGTIQITTSSSINTTSVTTFNSSEIKQTKISTSNAINTTIVQQNIHTTQSTHSIISNITTSIDIKPVTTSLFVEPTTTTFNEGPVTTSYHTPPTSTSLSVNPVTTSITNSIVTTPIATTTTINVQEGFRSSPCVFGFNNGRYEKDSSIPQNNIGNYIKKVPVNITLSNNWVIIEYMEAYEILNIDIEEAVTVKLKNTDEYYLFRNIYYKKEELNQ